MIVPPSPASVLVVEDNGDDYELIAELLRQGREVELDWEDSFEGGLRKFRTGRFDVVLLDYGLGHRTGIEFLHEAKGSGSRAPIIIVTGRGDRDVDLAAMAAGADDYLVKGEFSADHLERSIRYAMERNRVSVAPVPPGGRSSPEGPGTTRVLLVEDDENDYSLVSEMLSEAGGCSLTWAPSFGDGLDRLRRGTFDVVLLDHSLGKHSGLEFLREAKSAGCDLPVIMTTGMSDRETDLAAMVAGADEFLVKGRFDAQLLERCIRYAIERRRSREALRESEERFRNLADSAPVMIWVSDRDNGHTYFNRTWLQFRGRPIEDELGQGWLSGVHPDDAPGVRKACLGTGGTGVSPGPIRLEFRLRNAAGDYRWIACYANARTAPGGDETGRVGSCIDITERKRTEEERAWLEAQRAQFERLDTVATLASGIAHDFNNILASILMHGEQIAALHPEGDPVHHQVALVNEAVGRAASLIQQLRTFTRSAQVERVSVPLGAAVGCAMEALAPSCPGGVRMTCDLDPGCPPVAADPDKIQQLLIQVGTNGIQAIANQPGGGTLAFKLGQVLPGEDLRRRNPGLQARRYAVITVTDDGPGMDPVSRDRVFEPFFSGRGVGRSGGLGLSVAHGIVTGLGGEITVESELGRGTTFAIYLPLVRGETAPGWGPAGSAPPAGPAASAPSRRIMVVDDDVSIAGATAQILEHYGYSTEAFPKSFEALEAIRSSPGQWSLLITDQCMPVLTGTQLARAAREAGADFPVILTSGFPSSLAADEFSDLGIRAFLQKPVSRHDLLAAIEAALAT